MSTDSTRATSTGSTRATTRTPARALMLIGAATVAAVALGLCLYHYMVASEHYLSLLAR